jgi:WD40 repeat protein
MAYSANGKMIGIYFCDTETVTGSILICDVVSGACIHHYSLNGDIPLSNNIWTHGESLWYATADATTITIWEVGFISGGPPMKVETLPTPDGFDPTCTKASVKLLPAPYRLAIAFAEKVLVWDLRNSKCLLDYSVVSTRPLMSFSSDGRFFALSVAGPEIYLWKESPTGYIFHGTLESRARHPIPLFSRNGESIVVFSGRTIKLWRTNIFTTRPFGNFTQTPQLFEDSTLDFSPDGALAVVAVQQNRTATVLDLESGVPQFTIDTGIKVYGLRVIGNTVVVIGHWEVIAWDLPARGCVPNARVGPEDSSWKISPGGPQEDDANILGASISPDFRHIAFTRTFLGRRVPCLCIYSASTGERLGFKVTHGDIPWFSPDGCDIWCATRSGEAEVWRVGGERDMLEDSGRTVGTEDPPDGYPWRSSCGYRVTDDWWILGPDGKRLLMLPPHWQSYAVSRVWKGQFLALLHRGLPEPVILEVEL